MKAWLLAAGGRYPPTHDLLFLRRLLGEAGEDVADLGWIDELIPFAVHFRYEPLPPGEEGSLDRTGLLGLAETLATRITSRLRGT